VTEDKLRVHESKTKHNCEGHTILQKSLYDYLVSKKFFFQKNSKKFLNSVEKKNVLLNIFVETMKLFFRIL